MTWTIAVFVKFCGIFASYVHVFHSIKHTLIMFVFIGCQQFDVSVLLDIYSSSLFMHNCL